MFDTYSPLFELGWHLHLVLTTAFLGLAVGIGCSVRSFLTENPGPRRPKGAWLCLASDITSKTFLVVAVTGVITMSLQLALYLPSSAETEPSDLAATLTSELQTQFLNGSLDGVLASAIIDQYLGSIPDSASLQIDVTLPSAVSFLVICGSDSEAGECEVHSNFNVDREPNGDGLDDGSTRDEPLSSTLERLASSPGGLTPQSASEAILSEAILKVIGPLQDYNYLDFRVAALPQHQFHCEPNLTPSCYPTW